MLSEMLANSKCSQGISIITLKVLKLSRGEEIREGKENTDELIYTKQMVVSQYNLVFCVLPLQAVCKELSNLCN